MLSSTLSIHVAYSVIFPTNRSDMRLGSVQRRKEYHSERVEYMRESDAPRVYSRKKLSL